MNDSWECARPGRDGSRLTAGAAIMAVIAVLGGLGIWAQITSGSDSQLIALDVGTVLVCCALVPVLLRHLTVTAVALGCLAVLSPAATPAATLAALYVSRYRPLRSAVAVAAVGVVAHVLQAWWRPAGGISLTWWIVLDLVAYAALVALGALAQARAAAFAAIRDRADRAEAEQGRRVAEARAMERTRIAREMHDVLAHRLSLLATYAGALEYRPDASPEQLAKAAAVIRGGVGEALDELRGVIGVLRDDGSADFGGADDQRHPQPGIADLTRLVEESRDAGTRVELALTVTHADEVPASTARAVYRVVQEALTNARKHAPGEPVTVSVDGRPGTELRIGVLNPLGDRTAEAPGDGTGNGLLGLTERVRLCGGRLDHTMSPGDRFELQAHLPWPS